MIKIKKWWEEFENATSRKLKNLRHFSSAAGNDSKGYRKLMRSGTEGLVAFGVFQALCQAMATLSQEARKEGAFRNSDGSIMEMDDLSDLTRIPDEALALAIDRLIKIGWVEPLETLENQQSPIIPQQSASEIPSPPNDLPTESQDPPNGEEGIGGDSIGGEGSTAHACGGSPSPPAPADESVDENPMETLKSRINGLRPVWGKPAHWSYAEEQNLHGGTAAQMAELDDDDWQLLKRYLAAPTTKGEQYWRPNNRSRFTETFADVWQSCLRWAEKNGGGSRPQRNPSSVLR